MKKILFISTLLFITVANATGQVSAAPIEMRKVFGGSQFYQGGKRLNMNQLVDVMQPNAQAYEEIRKAKSTQTWASIVGGIGGFMVGWPIGTAIGGGDPNWTMAGIGAGLVVVSIPISQKFNRQATSAVDQYNQGLQSNSFWNKRELKLEMTANGIGLALHF